MSSSLLSDLPCLGLAFSLLGSEPWRILTVFSETECEVFFPWFLMISKKAQVVILPHLPGSVLSLIPYWFLPASVSKHDLALVFPFHRKT